MGYATSAGYISPMAYAPSAADRPGSIYLSDMVPGDPAATRCWSYRRDSQTASLNSSTPQPNLNMTCYPVSFTACFIMNLNNVFACSDNEVICK